MTTSPESAPEPVRCPYCGGVVKAGWSWHPSCKRLAEATS